MIYPENDARDMLASAKFFEGYSRFDHSLDRYETWEESVDRIVKMHRKKYAHVMTDELSELLNWARDLYVEKRILGSQRALQFGGEQILKHEMKLYNCTSSYADRPEFFGEILYILLCGAGAGFSVQGHHVGRLPMIRPRTKQTKMHIVADSIEGWATALDVLMSSFFVGGGKHPEYEGRKVYFDFNNVRESGSPISGGFIAPGPDGLARSLTRIERLMTGISEEGVMRPIDVYDVVMHAADAVLSGGVRRSATICLFSPDDDEMLRAKTGDWFHTNPQRARSNNSVVLERDLLTETELEDYVSSIRQYGEPGIILTASKEHCYNPCVEIGMLPHLDGRSGWQGCNLVEINGAACSTAQEFYDACGAAAVLGTLQAGYTDFKFLDEVTSDIFKREALLGVSVTGWMNSPSLLLQPKVQKFGAVVVKDYNVRVAEMIGINPAARTTCVKPSGNASVLLGTTSALNGEHAPRYIRNVQMTQDNPVAREFSRLNPYMVEDSVWSAGKTDVVISFPIIPPSGSEFRTTGVEQLMHVRNVQKNWIEEGTVVERCVDPTLRHNVSNTVVVRDYEWDNVIMYVYRHRNDFCGLSFISDTGDRDYNQAPFVAIPSSQDIVDRYGRAALFMSGLIVDLYEGYRDPWEACDDVVRGHGTGGELEDKRSRWFKRFVKFAQNYFDGDLRETEMCLKDVFLLHKWTKIQSNFVPMDIADALEGASARGVEVDTLAALSCHSGVCEI